ncbi:CorA metal ion transporter [Podochytrium sp. JEL0797]|nr:CorA metal ion transporter [Podochytrium sp. JEL0797]
MNRRSTNHLDGLFSENQPLLVNDFFEQDEPSASTPPRQNSTEFEYGSNPDVLAAEAFARRSSPTPPRASFVERRQEDSDDELSEDAYFRSTSRPHLNLETIAEYLAKHLPATTPTPPIKPFKINTSTYSKTASIVSSRKPSYSTTSNSSYKHSQLQNRFSFYSPLTQHITSSTFETLALPYPLLTTLQTSFWLDVCCPSDTDLATLSRLFKIHPLTAEDVQTGESREKCESFPNYYFIVIRSVEEDYGTGDLVPINVYILVFRECVLTFHSKPMIHVPNVLHRIDRLNQYGLTVSPDWLNYALMDDIADGFVPLLEYTEHEVDSIDALVLILKEKEQTDMLLRIGKARKSVMTLLRLLNTKAEVIKAVIKRSSQMRSNMIAPDSETGLYLGDIQDHIITMIQNLNHYEKTLARAHSNYLAQISIEITQASNRTNDVGTKMTALASILVPLNVITGLWGMNVKVPGQDIESLHYFYGIVFFMCVLAYVCWAVVRRFNLV